MSSVQTSEAFSRGGLLPTPRQYALPSPPYVPSLFLIQPATNGRTLHLHGTSELWSTLFLKRNSTNMIMKINVGDISINIPSRYLWWICVVGCPEGSIIDFETPRNKHCLVRWCANERAGNHVFDVCLPYNKGEYIPRYLKMGTVKQK